MNETVDVPLAAGGEPAPSLITVGHIVYACYALGFFIGITWIVGVIIAYVKRDEAAGTWLASHFGWQIRTFWWGLLWCILFVPVAFVLFMLIITIPLVWVLGAVYVVWLIYRIVRGWLLLNERKPTPA